VLGCQCLFKERHGPHALLKRQSDEARERIADVHAELCVQRWGVTAYLRRHATHTLKEAVETHQSCVQRWGVTAYLRRHETRTLKEAVEAHQRVVRIRNRTAICVSSR
jgi:hypothetical protein